MSIGHRLDSPQKLIDFKDLKATRGISFSRTHLANLENEGKFPKRVQLGAHRIGWVMAEIDEWLAARIASR
jgi:prophage regulatory protein